MLYSGGMPRASYGDRHCLTIQKDKEHVTLDFTSRVIDFFTVHSIEQEKGQGAGHDVSFQLRLRNIIQNVSFYVSPSHRV